MRADVDNINGNLDQFDRDINLAINFKFSNYRYLIDYNNLSKTKFTPTNGENSFRSFFEITDKKKIAQLAQILAY